MKHILLIIICLSISFNANSEESIKVSISTNNNYQQQQTNTKTLSEIKEDKNLIGQTLSKHQKCKAKGMIYLKPGDGNVDSDGCFDINNIAASNIRPTLAGFIGPASFVSGAADYNTSFLGRFSADKLCNTAFNKSRAMTYADLKYILPTLNLPANIDNAPIWVYDSIESLHNNGSIIEALSKYGEVVNGLNDCNGWTSTSADSQGMILEKTVDTETYLSISYQACNISAHIACIYN